ncbi:MAG: amidohydrolase [Hungatella sp.]|nr:amidohydrolase [Hungatella sp.]
MRTLYNNGRLYTGDEKRPEASAMVVEDGVITWVGENPEEAMGENRSWDESIDLKGRFVTPGFIDSHMHVVEYGKLLQEVSLADFTGSLKAVCHRVKEFIREKQVPEGAWVCGRGWNQDYFEDEKRFINCHDLDEVSTRHPIFLARACGHVVAVNSKAMELAGVTRESAQPSDGRFQVDSLGEPLGIFEENAISMVKDAIPAVTAEKVKEYILEAERALNRFGITSVHTDDFLSLNGGDYEMVLKAYRELEEEGRLTVKVCEQSQFEDLEQLKEFVDKGYHTGSGSDYVKIGPLKIIGDGSLGARTAFLGAPYADKPDTRGIPVFSQDQLDEMISYANSHGMQAAVHAIGDGIMEQVVLAYEKALKEYPRKDHRHGIVHCQITTEALLEKIRDLSLHAYIQSIFLDYDSRIVESRVGREKASKTYQFKTLMDMGCSVSNGSDSPVETPDVMKGIQCAVTRTSLDKTRTFLPDQALTLEEALKSYTVMGAWAEFEEEKKGRLKEGMAADFVVLSRDLREVPLEQISQVRVEQTYVDGVLVFERR